MQQGREYEWPHRGQAIAVSRAGFLNTVYGWMALGLIITALCAAWVYQSEPLQRAILGNRLYFYGLIAAEFGLVIAINAAMQRISASTMGALFALYSGLNGLTLSVVLFAYTGASVAGTFMISAGTFGAMSLWGLTTKRDLSGVGALASMALIGVVLASLVNLFLRSDGFSFLISLAGVAVFVGLTAYDTQKLKQIHESGLAIGEDGRKLAIRGALALYLDFINLFLFLLRLLGRRR